MIVITDEPKPETIDLDSMLTEISSYYQVVELLRTQAKIKEDSVVDLRRVLQWRLPISLKPVKNEAIGIGEIQMLYTIEDIFSQLQSQDFMVVGRLENVVML